MTFFQGDETNINIDTLLNDSVTEGNMFSLEPSSESSEPILVFPKVYLPTQFPFSITLQISGYTYYYIYKESDIGSVKYKTGAANRWIQVGSNINGPITTTVGPQGAGDGQANMNKWFGWSVSMSSDGNRIVVGAPYQSYRWEGSGDWTLYCYIGRTRIYDYNGSNWIQLGNDNSIRGVHKELGATYWSGSSSRIASAANIHNVPSEKYADREGWSVSLSGDGTRVASGAPYYDEGSDNSAYNKGRVRVFNWTDGVWSQVGGNLYHYLVDTHAGWSVSLSKNGNRLALHERGPLANNKGIVKIYELSGSTWQQKGKDIIGEDAEDGNGSGFVSLNNDGSRVVIGAKKNQTGTGHVRVYEWRKWLGSLDSDKYYVGPSYSETDMTHATKSLVANSYYSTEGIHNNLNQYLSTGAYYWMQMGFDIDGEFSGDESGTSVSINGDGNRIAIGAPKNQHLGYGNVGHVRVYEWRQYTSSDIGNYRYESRVSDNSVASLLPIIITTSDGSSVAPVVDEYYWMQLGYDINGEENGDYTGYSVSLNQDGTRIAIGVPESSSGGYVRMYQWNGSIWEKIGTDLTGEVHSGNIKDKTGWSVSLNDEGNRIVIGSPQKNGPSTSLQSRPFHGYVSVYQLLDPVPTPFLVNCLTPETIVNIVDDNGNKYVFNNKTTYNSHIKWGLNTGIYTFKNISSSHPMAILNADKTELISYIGDDSKKFSKTVTDTTSDGDYDFYYGDITVTVSGDFEDVSIYCYNHDYMGGENLLRFSTTCTSPPGPVVVDDTADAADEILDATEDTSGYTSGGATGISIGDDVTLELDDIEDFDLDSGGGY